MNMYKCLSILLLILTTSCARNNKNINQKLLFFSFGSMCTYDSMGKPQLSIRTYFDYTQDHDIKVAKGDWKYIFEKNAPPYSLDKFYTISETDSLKKLIALALDTYTLKDRYLTPGEGLIYVLIYKTENSRKQIIYRPDSLPKSLKELHIYLTNLINSKDLQPISPFSVDSILINYEKQQFLKYPPPPAPTPIDSTIKFTLPVVEDTVK